MANTVNLIMGIIYRINLNQYRNNNKKMVNQLTKQLKLEFNKLLNCEDENDFANNFAKLYAEPSSRVYIDNNLFPSNMYEYAVYGNVFGYSNSIEKEIRWIVYCILENEDVINDFIKTREQYDYQVLLSKYQEALNTVEEFERTYGVSYWTYECKFYLYPKLDLNSSELLENTGNTIFGSILNFYELKNRSSITSDEFFYIAQREVKEAKSYLNDNDLNDAIEFLNYSLSSNILDIDLNNILSLMTVIQHCSLIDRYIFLVKICEAVVGYKENVISKGLRKYLPILKNINDNHLIALRFILEEEKGEFVLKSRLDDAKSMYIKGNIEASREKAIELLKLFPNNVEALIMLIDTNTLLGVKCDDFEQTNLGLLIQNLTEVLLLSESRDDAIEEVNKLALTCSMSTWAAPLLSAILCTSVDIEASNYLHEKMLNNSQHLSIETVLLCLEKKKAKEYLSQEDGKVNTYFQFEKAILEDKIEDAMEICNVREINDLIFINSNQPTEKKLERLKTSNELTTVLDVQKLKCFLNNIDIENDFDIVARLATKLVIQNIYTSLFIPWKRIIEYIENGPSEVRRNICTPILYYVYAYYFDRDKKDDLGIICGDFFDFNEVDRPSRLQVDTLGCDIDVYIYFLKNVCIAKTLDDSLFIFDSSEERDQERIEICNILSKMDSDNIEIYGQEIRDIIQKLMINKELKKIDESRIHVNVDGIRTRLNSTDVTGKKFDSSIKNDFQRLQFYLDERSHQWFALIKGESNSFDELHSALNRLLKEIVFKVRNAFVSSDEFGLDGYLSLNIRHNTLQDELRSPFHKEMLLPKRDSKNKRFVVDDSWTRFLKTKDEKLVEQAFEDFYNETEGILTKLVTKYIQIKTEEKNVEGLFDYCLYEDDIVYLWSVTENIEEFEDFFNAIIEFLWLRTERNLEYVKKVIHTEIKNDYLNALHNFADKVETIDNSQVSKKLIEKISEAEIDLQNSLDHISYWFQRSNESMYSDFELQFAFDLGLQTVKNLHHEKEFIAIALEPSCSDKIAGEYLKFYDGIFYNIFDNIYKKAMTERDGRKIIIKYKLRNQNNKTYIYVENKFDCSGDIEGELKKLETAKELWRSGRYLDKVRGEGGTGIPKICKIIQYDLGKKADICFDYDLDQNIFFIKIEF